MNFLQKPIEKKAKTYDIIKNSLKIIEVFMKHIKLLIRLT